MSDNKKDLALIEVNPEVITTVDRADRSDWNYELYVSTGMEISQVKGYSQWVLGKLVSEVAKKFGDIKDYGKAIGVAPESLYVYKFTYENIIKKYPDFINDGRFPFSLLQEAARTDDPKETLNEFEEKDIHTLDAARRHIIKKKTGEDRPRKPRVSFGWNPELNKWDMKLDDQDIPNINWLGIRSKLVSYIVDKNS